ncbi:LapA family protein [Actinotalea solisilvae]|uniref:LapA family protein n=1 Tax=Actinotalea solisilvae TaxID=2072922 RepID=UPI0018F22DA3|nr:lipopolysaccharide assembly protein LapA domain-containing protein [Actinotalea solisilvae]
MPVQRTSSDDPSATRDRSAPAPAVPAAAPPPGAAPGPGGRPSRLGPVRLPVSRTRAGAAWVGISLGALVLVLLIVFMMQNTEPVEVVFLGMRGSAPLALTLLIAGVGVGLVALVVGSLRIGQLRRRIGADRRAAEPASRTAP